METPRASAIISGDPAPRTISECVLMLAIMHNALPVGKCLLHYGGRYVSEMDTPEPGIESVEIIALVVASIRKE